MPGRLEATPPSEGLNRWQHYAGPAHAAYVSFPLNCRYGESEPTSVDVFTPYAVLHRKKPMQILAAAKMRNAQETAIARRVLTFDFRLQQAATTQLRDLVTPCWRYRSP